MKTYVVNMEKDAAKKAAIEAQLRNHPELDYQIWKATEGRKLSVEELAQAGYNEFKRKYGDFGTLPAFGCSLSHYNIYCDMSSSSNEMALILEDDAILSEDFSTKINRVQTYFATIEEPSIMLLTPDFSYKKSKLLPIEGTMLQIVPLLGGYMTSGYLINKKGAKLLADKLFPIRYIADEWQEFQHIGLSVYGVVPHIVSYHDVLGEIGTSQQSIANDSFIKNIRHMLGRIKGRIYRYFEYINGVRWSKKMW